MKRVWIALGLIGIFACGGGDKKPPFVPKTTPGDSRDASVDEPVDAGGADIDMPAQTGPVLQFTTPEPAHSPNDDTLITSRDVTVRCRVTQRPGVKAAVDRSSIKITLDKNKEGTSVISAPALSVGEDDYEAKFDLSTFDNGVLRFHCEAKDMAVKPASSSITLQTLLDLGPKIELFTPKDKGVYALGTPVAIQFQVDPAPVVDGDSESEIKSVHLQISGVDKELTENPDKPGLYQTSVNFGDKKQFKVPPTASEVLITAMNGRTPDAATRTLKVDIGIDGVGPTISVVSPAYSNIVHGEVTLVVNVTDPAGVAPHSLKANINDGLLEIADWDVMGTTYQQVFDTRKFGSELTQLTMNLTATDSVGNQATIPHFLRLDNEPPLLSLDPPVIREWHKSGENSYCSRAFDPLGDATNDQQHVDTASVYRVLVEDQTNVTPGSNVSYLAGLSPASVTLYVQPNRGVPLLIDTNNDHFCDEINFFDLPMEDRPTKIGLRAVVPRGASWFAKPTNFDTANPDFDITGAFCSADPNGADLPPNDFCPLTQMTRAVAGHSSDKPPAVYGLNPTNNDQWGCEGETWNVGDIVHTEGWYCLAARAEDTIGNVGIAEAIRVCFDRQDGGADPCAGPIPECNKNCTISPAQRYRAHQFWEVR
jgi:hypothetical protein